MRTSRDQYINPLGKIIELPQNDQAREFIKQNGLNLWNGYDYEKQEWVFEGKKDTRSLEELQASIINN